MSTITLPNIRVGSDLQVRVRLKDGGVAIDWSTLSNIKAYVYSDAQRAMAGRCTTSVDGDDPTLLVCNYAATKPQYLGANRIIVSCSYMGVTKTYDKPAFTFVRWSEDQAGEEITIEDPEVTVEIDVEDVTSSILQNILDACIQATEEAREVVDVGRGPRGYSAYEVAVQDGFEGTEEEWLESLQGETGPQGPQGEQGETGPAGVTDVEVDVSPSSGTPAGTGSVYDGTLSLHFTGLKGQSAYEVAVENGFEGTEEEWLASLVGPQGQQGVKGDTGAKGDKGDTGETGPQGPQGNTGASVNYPYELVNNETTDDATKGHSAAGGKRLNDKISQLEAKVDDMEVETNEDSDLDIIDENAYSIARFQGGHIKTKNFDSSDMSKDASDSSDFDIIDPDGHSIVRFEDGHIKVKNFDSGKIKEDFVQKDLDIFFNSASENQHYDTVNSTTKNLSFPYDLKKNICFALKGEFSSFATITMGKGYNAYSGYWFVIDSTSISLYANQGTTALVKSVAHGLTFSDFVKIVISNIGDDYCRFFIQTRGGQFAYNFGWTFAANGQTFFTTAGTLTNVDFIASCSDLKNDVWLFGDSYVGMANPARWPKQLRTMGYSNFLCDGLAGQNSNGAYSDLQRCLALGVKPKFLIWTLGMNDTDSAWNTTYQQVETLCESNDITLILATVPSVPSRNKETINTAVRNSGYDYIDFAYAVGAISSGVWYSGYLSSDEVHPTELGAKALATQFIFDFILKH